MPHIAITMIPGRDDEAKRALAKKVRASVVDELGIDSKVVSVSVEDIPREGWAKSMKPFSDEVMFVRPNTEISADEVAPFSVGAPNDAYAQYFIGQSYLDMLTTGGVPIGNVTFAPGCRNNWHIHKAGQGGGQILLCTGGRGWYQEWGKPARALRAGDVVRIPAGVKHWHGAAKNSWFAHLAVEVPGEKTENQWLEPVDDEQYSALG